MGVSSRACESEPYVVIFGKPAHHNQDVTSLPSYGADRIKSKHVPMLQLHCRRAMQARAKARTCRAHRRSSLHKLVRRRAGARTHNLLLLCKAMMTGKSAHAHNAAAGTKARDFASANEVARWTDELRNSTMSESAQADICGLADVVANTVAFVVPTLLLLPLLLKNEWTKRARKHRATPATNGSDTHDTCARATHAHTCSFANALISLDFAANNARARLSAEL